MSTFILRFLALLLFFCLGACSPLDRKINAKDMTTWNESVKAVRADLKNDDLDQFNKAVDHFAQTSPESLMSSAFTSIFQRKTLELSNINPLPTLDGKTGRELIALALKQKKEGATAKMTELKLQILAIKSAKITLDKIKVEPGDIRTDSRNMFMVEVVLFMAISNSTDRAIKKIDMQGQVVTEGREIPWIDQPLSYTFPGGLEKGESQHLILKPNMFSEWAKPEIARRRDVQLKIAVTNIQWADGTFLIESGHDGPLKPLPQLEKTLAEMEINANAKKL